jgi:hypothetical protein
MYGREQRVLLRHYLEQGLAKAEIARRLGISLRTLYYWIEAGQLDRALDDAPVHYRPRPAVACKIDGFTGIITARLAEYPRLTAGGSSRRSALPATKVAIAGQGLRSPSTSGRAP